MTLVVTVNIYNPSVINFRRITMTVTKEILSVFSGKEPAIDLLSSLLLNSDAFADEIRKIAESTADRERRADDG